METDEAILDYILLSKDDYMNVLNEQERSSEQNRRADHPNADESDERQSTINDQQLEKAKCEMSVKMLREQDLYLPITNIFHIMKRPLERCSTNAKIAKEAKMTMQECVSEFIQFITSEAIEMVKTERRRTLNGHDLIMAMQQLGFDKYVEPLKIYLQKYKQATSGDNETSNLLNSEQK